MLATSKDWNSALAECSFLGFRWRLFTGIGLPGHLGCILDTMERRGRGGVVTDDGGIDGQE